MVHCLRSFSFDHLATVIVVQRAMPNEIQVDQSLLTLQKTAREMLDRDSMIRVDHPVVREMNFDRMPGLMGQTVAVVRRMVVRFLPRPAIS